MCILYNINLIFTLRNFIVRNISFGLCLLTLTDTAIAADPIRMTDLLPEVQFREHDRFADWQGRYAGISLGYALNPTSSLEVYETIGSASVSKRKFMSSDGLMGSVFAGYNLSINNFIVGGEGDVDLIRISDIREIYGGGGANVDLNLQGNLRARIGYQIANALIYSGLGLAIADVEYSAIAADGSTINDDAIEIGYSAAVGMDYAFTPNMFSRLEYRYTEYFGGEFSTNSDGYELEFDTNIHALRAGAGLRF